MSRHAVAHMTPLTLLLLTFAQLVACGARELHSSQTKIVKGVEASSRDYPVVSLLKRDSSGLWYSYCTGVMITPARLLTAAHCSRSSETGLAYAPEDVRVVWGVDAPEAMADNAHVVQQVLVHPEYDTGAMGKDKDGLIRPGAANDIAVWDLATPLIDEGFVPARLASAEGLSERLTQEHTIRIMGFGQTSAWSSPWETHRFRMATTPYHPRLVWTYRKRELVGGRMVTRTVTTDFPAFSAGEFYAGERGAADTCKGDSGGPAFIEAADGQWELLGLTSRGDSNCDRGGVYTLVPTFVGWIGQQAAP